MSFYWYSSTYERNGSRDKWRSKDVALILEGHIAFTLLWKSENEMNLLYLHLISIYTRSSKILKTTAKYKWHYNVASGAN